MSVPQKHLSGLDAPRILIVDDEEANRVLLAALLGAHGYRTVIAEDGPSALEELRLGSVDLMLLDVMMPGMDGLEVCRRIREELEMRDLTVVIITALSDRESRLRAKAAGASDFLVKPVDSFELSFRVENWLKMRRLTQLERSSHRLLSRLTHSNAVREQAANTLRQLANLSLIEAERQTLHDELLRCAALLSGSSEEP